MIRRWNALQDGQYLMNLPNPPPHPPKHGWWEQKLQDDISNKDTAGTAGAYGSSFWKSWLHPLKNRNRQLCCLSRSWPTEGRSILRRSTSAANLCSRDAIIIVRSTCKFFPTSEASGTDRILSWFRASGRGWRGHSARPWREPPSRSWGRWWRQSVRVRGARCTRVRSAPPGDSSCGTVRWGRGVAGSLVRADPRVPGASPSGPADPWSEGTTGGLPLPRAVEASFSLKTWIQCWYSMQYNFYQK